MDLQRALNFEEFANKETNRRPYIYDLSACVLVIILSPYILLKSYLRITERSILSEFDQQVGHFTTASFHIWIRAW